MRELYQCIKHPDGTWGVVQLIASFVDEERARAYTLDQNGRHARRAEPPRGAINETFDGTHLTIRHDPRGMTGQQFDDAFVKVRDALPALFKEFPLGMTTRNLQERYGLPYDRACQIFRNLHTQGLGQYVHVNGKAGPKIFVSPDVEVAESDLTSTQFNVLGTLTRDADSHGLIEVSSSLVATKANVAVGSVPYVVGVLEKKGYLMLAKPSGGPGGKPPTYQITEKARSAILEVQ